MSTDTEGLARFDTRQGRAVQTEESSEQTDFRTIGAREHGQLALDEVESETENGAVRSEQRASSSTPITTGDPTHTDLKAALGCASATIDGLQERIEKLEAERDRLREERGYHQ